MMNRYYVDAEGIKIKESELTDNYINFVKFMNSQKFDGGRINVELNDIWKQEQQAGETEMSYIFKFGIHKGKVITDSRIENGYLESLIRYNEEGIKTFRAELDRRAAVECATDSMATQIIQAGYRALAKQYHPDMGGDPTLFQELVGTKAILAEIVEKLK